jgi:hypothetical protein
MGDTTEADRRDQIEQAQGESTPGQRGVQTEQQGRQKKWILTGRTSVRAQVAVDWPTKKSKHGREKLNPQGHGPPGHTPVRQKTLDPPGDSLREQNHKMDFEQENGSRAEPRSQQNGATKNQYRPLRWQLKQDNKNISTKTKNGVRSG